MRIALLMVLSLAFAVCPASAQQPTQPDTTRTPATSHTVRGRVYLPSGQPAGGSFRVTLRTFTQGTVQEGYTDSIGNFEFRGIPGGTYEIVVWGNEQFETAIERIELSGRIARTFSQSIFLGDKEKAAKDKTQPGVVSLAELSANIPKEARKEYERGLKDGEKGEHEKAIARFEKAIALYPQYFQAHNDLGVQHMRLNRFAEAEAAFNRASEIEPRAPQPHLNLGFMRITQNQFQAAVPSLNRAIELDGRDWTGHMWLGVAMMGVKDLAAAKSELEKALSLGTPPGSSEARLYLSNVYMRQGDWPRAIEQAELYLKEAPDAPNAPEVKAKVAQMRSAVKAQNKDQRP